MQKCTIQYQKYTNLYEVFINKDYIGGFSTREAAKKCIEVYKLANQEVTKQVKKFKQIKTLYDLLDYR